MSKEVGHRSVRLTRGRLALALGIVALVLAGATISQWRADAATPAGVTHVDDARRISQMTNDFALLPLRFVEAHVVEARCRPGDTVTAYVFEPTVPFFGDLRSYALAEFPPASCTLDCVGTIVGATRAEYDAVTTGGGAVPCA